MSAPADRAPRREVRGQTGAPGVALAQALVLSERLDGHGEPGARHSRRYIAREACPHELARVRQAVQRARNEIDAARAQLIPEGGEPRAIFDAYLLMLDDPLLHERVRQEIEQSLRCADWAVAEAGQYLHRAFAQLQRQSERPRHLVERGHDVEFVIAALLRALSGESATPHSPPNGEGWIVIARELSPVELVQLDRRRVRGVIVERGTPTSHTAIVARALDLPTLVGATGATSCFHTGEPLWLDAHAGVAHTDPAPPEPPRAHAPPALDSEVPHGAQECSMQLSATIQLPEELEAVRRVGAHGVGLCRTEFLFLAATEPPSEQAQYAMYLKLAQGLDGAPLVLRTFDLGGDKPSLGLPLPAESNPALGLRGVRVALRWPALLQTQLRAMIRAAAHADVRILLPMVATLEELRAVAQHLHEAKAALGHTGHVPLGVMVELPSVALLAEQFAREVDFFAIGTNDLTQYTLGVDRGSANLSQLASPFEPSVLQLIERTLRGAHAHGRAVSVCGASASEPLAAVLYTGLGVHSLSTYARALPHVRWLLGQVGRERAERLSQAALQLGTAHEIEALLRQELAPWLAQLA